jgi:hypothetical protein
MARCRATVIGPEGIHSDTVRQIKSRILHSDRKQTVVEQVSELYDIIAARSHGLGSVGR